MPDCRVAALLAPPIGEQKDPLDTRWHRSARNWRLIGTLAARGENWLQEEFFSARRNQIFQKISGDSEFLIPIPKITGSGEFFSNLFTSIFY